jgi:hypothetical protein
MNGTKIISKLSSYFKPRNWREEECPCRNRGDNFEFNTYNFKP